MMMIAIEKMMRDFLTGDDTGAKCEARGESPGNTGAQATARGAAQGTGVATPIGARAQRRAGIGDLGGAATAHDGPDQEPKGGEQYAGKPRKAVLQGAERRFISAHGADTQLGFQGPNGLRARKMQPRIELFRLLQLAARDVKLPAREASSAATKCALALRG